MSGKSPDILNQADLLAGVLDSSLDGIIAFSSVRNAAGTIVDFRFDVVNRMAGEVTGRDASELLGNNMLDVFPGNKEDGLFDAYTHVVETGEPFYTEHHYAHDGLNNWFSIKAAKCGDGFMVTFSDITEQKSTQEHFRVLFEHSTNAHLLFGEAGIIDCNQAAVQLLGYDDKEEILGVDPSALSPEFQPDGRRSEACVGMIQAARENGYHRFDWMHCRKDGTEIPVEVTLNPVNLSGEEAILAVWHDLTERIEAEREIRETATRLTEAQELANIGNWQWTTADNKIHWSEQVKRMFGLPLDEPAPAFETHRKQIHPDDVEHWEAVLQKSARDHTPYTMKFRAVRPDGETRTFESRGQCEVDEQGQLVRTHGTVQDITEAEAARSEIDKLSLVASRTDNSVVLMDKAARITWVNPAFTKLSGYRPEEVMGKCPPDVFNGPQTNPATIRRIKTSIQQGNGFTETVLKYHKDGSTFWSEIEVQPIRSDNGQIVNFMAIERDVTERIAHEQALEKERLRLEFALSASNTGLWDWKIDTEEVYFSNTWYTMLGYAPGEMPMSFETWSNLAHPEDLKRIQSTLSRYLKGQVDRYSLEIRLKNKAGDWQWVLTSGEAVDRDMDGNITRMVGLHVDIREQKRAQAEITAKRRQLEFALSASRTGLWDWTIESGETYFSNTWYTMLGYARGQFPMNVQSWIDLTHPEDLKRAMAALEAYFQGQADRYACEIRMKNSAGDWQWIMDIGEAAERDEQGKVTRMTGLHLDIHEQKQNQAKITAQQERLEFALNASNTGLWDWDVTTGESELSDTWYTMLGYDPKQLPKEVSRVQDLCHPADRAQVKQRTEAYLAGQTQRYIGEVRYKNSAGQWQWVLEIGEAVEHDEQGNITRIVGLNIDIDKQKRTQDELGHARDQAEQANTAKSAFLANMSHEIRTPMNAILGYADLLLDPTQTQADKRNHAQTIRRNGKHLLSILNDILDLSKIEAGKMTIERVSCAPSELFEDVINLMAPKADQQGIALKFQSQGDTPAHIKSDPTRIRQVLLNLIGNAIKFTHQGEVRLTTRFEQASDGTSLLVCDITDTGIGIDTEQMNSLFKPFSQADESTTRKFGGTGLGLSICKNLCHLLGGSLTCISTPGEGSTFTATFSVQPIQQVAAHTAPNQPAAAEANNDLTGRRVLVVEDGPDNQRLFHFYLKKANAQVTLAENGELGRDAALAAWQDGKPFDVILMDMQMPVLDGYQATTQLREAGYTDPIIALTAHASTTDRDKCLNAGCTDYLSKPVDRQKLIQLIAAHLSVSAT